MYPAELTHYRSWIVWRYEYKPGKAKAVKMPYSALTGKRADTTNPSDWCSYTEAQNYFKRSLGYFDGLGFVFSEMDEFSGIDIDDPEDDEARSNQALRVLNAFQSTYIERSPSKRGFHIIVRGKIPNERKRGGIEVYSTKRYFTMTGDTVSDQPIVELDYELWHLWHEIGGIKAELAVLSEGRPEQYLDTEVYEMGCAAEGEKNPGEHFKDLFHGKWQKWHNSQSQADQALCNYLVFYSRNPEQVRRIFLQSELGKRPKAHRQPTKNKELGYLDETIQKAFDKIPPEINLDMLMGNLQAAIEHEKKREIDNPKPMLGEGWELPPGLLGEIAEYIYQSAPRPVKEIALAAAIGLLAGVVGRAYNVSNTGLNHYVLVLAKTGCGKEAMKSGISSLINAIKNPNQPTPVNVAGEFIGPSHIASGQALIKYMGQNACFVSVLGEFGLTLQQICSPMASSSQVMLRQTILDLYNKSGINNSLEKSAYADKEKSTGVIDAPNFSILAETTPDSYFPHLTDAMVSQGLIPRFTSIEYTGRRPSLNKAHATVKPSEGLVARMVTLMTNSLTLQNNKRAIEVSFTPEAQVETDAFDKYCDDRHHNSESEVAQHLWTRAHIKLLKLSALIAVGVHAYEPVITLEHVKWARHLIEADVFNILNRFDQGQVGYEANEAQQVKQAVDAIKDYILRPWDGTLAKYNVKPEVHKDKIVTWSYLLTRLAQKVAFKKDRMGPTIALKRCVENLVNEGAIQKISAMVMHERYKSNAQAYAVTDLSRFTTL